mgnify:CR=1 FL=1
MKFIGSKFKILFINVYTLINNIFEKTNVMITIF